VAHPLVARPGPRLRHPRCGEPLAPLRLIFGLRLCVRYLGTSAFVSSNSKNISCVAFLKHKNRELALWHLVNRLVPENA
jgi:hypothetical protein